MSSGGTHKQAVEAVREYRGLVEQLYECLRAPNSSASSPHELTARIIATDERLQLSLGQLIEERTRRERADKVREQAEERQVSLLLLATRMQKAEANLATLIERSKEVLRDADAKVASDRHPTVQQVLEYAERVSYSNAAPIGAAAMEIAAKDGFRGGWGTPAPQQHMLAVSRFAMMQRPPPAEGSSEAAEAAPAARAGAPAAKRPRVHKAPAPPVASAEPTVSAVSLDLNPDDDDDD